MRASAKKENNAPCIHVPGTLRFEDVMNVSLFELSVGNSASTPVPATRNCAVDYCIAASIGVTDIRVQ